MTGDPVRRYHSHLEQRLKALDESAIQIVAELGLGDKLLPRASYPLGGLAREVYRMLCAKVE